MTSISNGRSAPLRVLGVEYLNARPLWESLRDFEVPSIDLGLLPPSELARALSEDEADVGPGVSGHGEVRVVGDMSRSA